MAHFRYNFPWHIRLFFVKQRNKRTRDVATGGAAAPPIILRFWIFIVIFSLCLEYSQNKLNAELWWTTQSKINNTSSSAPPLRWHIYLTRISLSVVSLTLPISVVHIEWRFKLNVSRSVMIYKQNKITWLYSSVRDNFVKDFVVSGNPDTPGLSSQHWVTH